MKDSIRAKTKRKIARDLFVELSEGMRALTEERQGRRTLRTHPAGYKLSLLSAAQADPTASPEMNSSREDVTND